MNVWKKGYTPTRVDDVIFKHRQCEWVLPLTVAEHLKYNLNHVPAIIYDVYTFADIGGTYVHIWERTRMFDFDYNRRVFAAYSGGEAVSPPPFTVTLLPEVRY